MILRIGRRRPTSAELRALYEGTPARRSGLLRLIALACAIYWEGLILRVKVAALERYIRDMPRIESERRKAEAFERALIANAWRPKLPWPPDPETLTAYTLLMIDGAQPKGAKP